MTEILIAVVTALLGLAVWFVKTTKTARDAAVHAAATSEDIMVKTMLVLLRNQLMAAHRNAVSNWEITIEEKNSFHEMHDLYIDLGGKPPASRLINDLDKVKLVVD